MSWRSVVALLVVAFVGGALAFAWLNSDGSMPWTESAESEAIAPEEANAPPAPAATITLPAPTIIQPSGSQAEALLLVLNARRAIEAGKPLGDLTTRLQVTFGQTQPQALATINSAAREPLSNATLLEDFDAIAPRLSQPTGTAWDRARYELATLFVLRRADAKPTALAARVNRAREALMLGDIAAAARTVKALPAREAAYGWLAEANRAIAVRQALDALDRSAALAVPPPPPVLVPPMAPEEPVIPTGEE
jgi:hypothetical protein